MHIPDGFLDLDIAFAFYILSGIVLAISIIKAKNDLSDRKAPLVGMIAASIFAAQMLNWPIPGGTSAHFVGGALAGIILGPFAGCIAMASVLVIQALVFADGGITALGANIWNMGIVSVFVGYYAFKLLERRSVFVASAIAGWLGITLAAIFAGIEIGLSSSFDYSIAVTVPVMGIWHGLLGIVEGFVTAGVVSYIATSRPDILEKPATG
ncbi:MAG: energy-coupling factor ABC transporter permease [Archaeoglobus sp.]|nr:energy-coupling factor ABC transporter permease [Archaeoglobus sp.]